MAPEPGNDWKILSDDEVCDWLRQWGFAIDGGTEVPQPDQTVNEANPIPMFGGRRQIAPGGTQGCQPILCQGPEDALRELPQIGLEICRIGAVHDRLPEHRVLFR